MHPEVLDAGRREIFSKLRKFSDFYLAGGTALALQIGCRVSVDFDLFSKSEIRQDLLSKAKSVFADFSVSLLVNNREELSILADKTKITFLHHPFPFVYDLVNYDGLSILSVKEIAITKAYTVGRRGSFKDYVDLYFILLNKYISLDEIISGAGKKYGTEFNDRLFLEQLIYLEDIEEEPIIFLKDAVSKAAIQLYLENIIKTIKL